MARLASIEKAGFYPLPTLLPDHIAALLQVPNGGRILDPCAGEGNALVSLATLLKLEPYAAEIHTHRGYETQRKLNELLQDTKFRDSLRFKDKGLNRAIVESFENIKTRKESMQVLYLNPPYDHGPGGDRLEYHFLKRATFWLQAEGILIYVVPQHTLGTKEISNYLSSWYEDIKVFPFPTDEYERFKQIVLIAKKLPKQEQINAEKKSALIHIAELQQSFLTNTFSITETSSDHNDMPAYIVPAPKHRIIQFQGLWITEDVIAREHHVYGNTKLKDYQHLFTASGIIRKRPLMPFKMGHIAGLLSAGLLNNVTLYSQRLNKSIMLKGRVIKKFLESTESHDGENGSKRTVKTTREIPQTELNTLDLDTGLIDTVPSADLPKFLKDWLPELTEAIQRDFSPIYTFTLGKYKKRIGNRATLLAAQKHIVAATATRLEKHNDAIIVGEMGTGKTRIGAVLVAACKFRRVLIVVPPHLIKKWIRETELSLPEARVIQIDRIGDVDKWFATDEKKQIQVALLKYTSARSASGWEHALPSNSIFTAEEAMLVAKYNSAINQVRMGHTDTIIPEIPDDLLQRTHLFNKWLTQKAKRGVQDSHMGQPIKDRKGNLLSTRSIKDSKKQFHHVTKPQQFKLSNERQRYVPFYQYKRYESSSNTYKQCAKRWKQLRPFSTGEMWYGPRSDWNPKDDIVKPHSRGRWRIADYIKKKYKNQIDCVIFDEAHMAKGEDTDQGYAMGRLSTAAKKTVLMTGTIYGGRASTLFYLLYRIAGDVRESFTNTAATGRKRILSKDWVELYGMWEHRQTTSEGGGGTGHNSGNKRVTENKKEAPGSSPAMLPWLLERTAFLSLADLNLELPNYTEIPMPIDPTVDQAARLEKLEAELGGEMRQRLAKGDRSLLGIYLQANLCWPDSPWRDEIIIEPKTKGTPWPKEICRIPALPAGEYPKEEAIIELCHKAVFEDQRKVLLLCQQTRTRDITKIWEQKLKAAGLNPVTLNVNPNRREAWINKQVKQGKNVLISHPKAVEVGLDLLEFPTIIWMGTEYSVYTIMQASRRSYRIGQDRDIEIYFFYYRDTLQEAAVSLIAQKTAASMRVNGDVIAQDSLAAADAGSIEDALARMVLNDKETHEHLVHNFFKTAAEGQEIASGFIGGYTIPEEDSDPDDIVVTKFSPREETSVIIGKSENGSGIVTTEQPEQIIIAKTDDVVAIPLDAPTTAATGQLRLIFGMELTKSNKSKKRRKKQKAAAQQLSLFDALNN